MCFERKWNLRTAWTREEKEKSTEHVFPNNEQSGMTTLQVILTEFTFFLTYLGDGNKSSSNPLNTDWTSPKQQTNDKRKPLDDTYAGVSFDLFHVFSPSDSLTLSLRLRKASASVLPTKEKEW